MRKHSLSVGALVALLAFLLSLLSGEGRALVRPQASVATWEVSGVVSEACSCDPICPCWFDKKPTLGHCNDVQVFQIEKGHYGDVRLDGLVLVSAVAIPEGETIRSGAAKLKLLAFYVDESTTQPQRTAIETIWRQHIFSEFKAARGELKAVALKTEIKPDHVKVSIPDILAYEVKEWKENRSKLVSEVHGWPYFGDVRQGSSVEYRYADYELNWNYPGKNAVFSTFKAKSPR